jgi:hypothetical protein
MTERKLKAVSPRLEALVTQDRDLLKALVKEALDQILQAETTTMHQQSYGKSTVGTPTGYVFEGPRTQR